MACRGRKCCGSCKERRCRPGFRGAGNGTGGRSCGKRIKRRGNCGCGYSRCGYSRRGRKCRRKYTGRYGRRYDTEGSGRHHRRKCERGRFAAYSVVGLAGRAGNDSFIQPVLLAAAQKDGTYGGPPSGQCL